MCYYNLKESVNFFELNKKQVGVQVPNLYKYQSLWRRNSEKQEITVEKKIKEAERFIPSIKG